MNNNFYKEIIQKILLRLILSFGCALPSVFIVYVLIKNFLNNDYRPAWIIFNFFYALIGIENIYLFIGFLFFTAYFILFSHRHIRYFVEIVQTVEKIEAGNFHQNIRVRSKDELSQLANKINGIVDRLKVAMEEERKTEQAKNELVTNVSHDLRTPLTSIIGYLRLIEEDRYKDEVELRYYTEIALHKSYRLERMVNDLFEYTKLNNGRNVLNRSEINLIELVGQLAADFTLQLAEAGMEIRLLFEDEKALLFADGDKLMRAFENLLSNAIKYGKKGRRVDVKLSKDKENVVLQVINYGSPIPYAELPYIFDRFYRVEKSRSEDTGGSGLGLAIVKNIVDLHKGSITVSSNELQTVFEIKLPLYMK